MTLPEAEKYYLKRLREVKAIGRRKNPWAFVCASVLLDCLAKIVIGRDGKGKGYVIFIDNYLAQANPRYKSFRYKNGKQDLPRQMYSILRCGIVHSFSFVPDPIAIRNGGRPRSVTLCHRDEAKRRNWSHLSPYADPKASDAALLITEDFLDDIEETIRLVFIQAKSSPQLKANIESWVTDYPPLRSYS